MFEFQFSDSNKINKEWEIEENGNLAPLMWGEHCIECSAPHCYFTCPRFKSRQDGHCRRFEQGIVPLSLENRLCARVNFKPWAKLEAKSEKIIVSSNEYGKIYKRVLTVGKLCAYASKLMPCFYLKSKFTGAWERFRMFLINRANSKPLSNKVELCACIVNDNETNVPLFLDLKGANGDLLMREKLIAQNGKTILSVSLPRYQESEVINIHPADIDANVELVFEELTVRPESEAKKEFVSQKKVKCVIWDLDNTLWNGVMIESDSVMLKPELVELIRNLDAKGIVNSIASKNDENQVMDVLNKEGIADLFVFKQINWNPKSQNIQKIIKGMNINANTFVFVDDNPFERDEVKSIIPDITCVDPSEIIAYAESERFNVPISEESAKRRDTYKMLEQLNKEQETWTGNIDSFLINCQITLTISNPIEQNISRCFELLQRTNQLNSSGRKLTMDELRKILNSQEYQCYVMESTDKFGDYGIVGFMIVKVVDCAQITDFVISCRVANKKIETTIINYLANKYGGEILFDFKKTKLNGPMKNVIDELKMEKQGEQGDMEIYQHKYNSLYPHIVTLIDKM